ncbi:MAG: hypothetical protein SOX83_05660 [Sodaliphilus sp.]|nr:hypothetical protein [Sodaliphilus sp.]
MENNKPLIDNELEQMRSQMAELKQMLDSQIRVNDQLLKKNIIDKSDKINRFGLTMLFLGMAAAILVPLIMYAIYHFSPACCIVTALLIACDASFDYYNAHRVKSIDIANINFTEALTTLVSMKKLMRTSFAVGMVALMPLMVWWAFEIYASPFFDMFDANIAGIARIAILVSLGFGVVVGIVVAVLLYNKQTRNITQLINTLKENQG